tara:strand:- start:162 stop:311 length:150 start_codon:yes stop_codon:yes gene_type:complete
VVQEVLAVEVQAPAHKAQAVRVLQTQAAVVLAVMQFLSIKQAVLVVQAL